MFGGHIFFIVSLGDILEKTTGLKKDKKISKKKFHGFSLSPSQPIRKHPTAADEILGDRHNKQEETDIFRFQWLKTKKKLEAIAKKKEKKITN